MTSYQFQECFQVSLNRFGRLMGEKPSSVRLGPDAQQGLREMTLSMSLKDITEDPPPCQINGPLGNMYGYPLFPMKANGVAAV